MNYEFADKAIKDLNRRALREFNGLRTLKFDELNVLRSVKKVYQDLVKRAKYWYLLIAEDAYIEALIEAGYDREEAEDMAEDAITDDWVLDMLEEYDGVTLYRFDKETERKTERTVEALLATENRNQEIDKALRIFVKQLAQYADNAVVQATIEGYMDGGVEYVRWHTQEDDKVCQACNSLDDKVFKIEDIPDRPHWRCRCWLSPAKGDET